VNGADAESLLNDAATATDVSQIATETDLVLFPWLGSQMQVAEQLRPARVACWTPRRGTPRNAEPFARLLRRSQRLRPACSFIVGIITPDDWRERCGERDGCHEFLQRVPAANRTRSPKDVPDGAIEGTRGAVRPANAEVALPTPYAHLVTRFRNGIRSASWRGRLKAQGLRTSAGRSIF
jgi:hypothetical protein